MRPRLSLLLAAGLLGCAGGGDPPLSPHGFIGAELPAPLQKPDLTFLDSEGHPFPLVQATAGKVTLLYFGYTHCPDVCPVHLANLAAVLDKLPEELQQQVMVIFVTTDPARDTPAVLHQWVKAFNPNFIGLTGSDSLLRAAQVALQLPPAIADTAGKGDKYLVGHAGWVLAFTKDGLGRVEYPFGTRQRDWAEDLPKLVAFGAGESPKS